LAFASIVIVTWSLPAGRASLAPTPSANTAPAAAIAGNRMRGEHDACLILKDLIELLVPLRSELVLLAGVRLRLDDQGSQRYALHPGQL
jgi:hypothetical protein